VALGNSAKALAERSFVYGMGGSSISYTTTRFSSTTATISAKDASGSGMGGIITLTEEKAKTYVIARGATSNIPVPIKSFVKNDDGSYTFTFLYSIPIEETTIKFEGGSDIRSTGTYSVLFGNGTITSSNSFLFGNGFVSAPYGVGLGQNLIIEGQNQFTIGKYNTSELDKAFVIGNGTSELRSNALTVDWNGNLKTAGSVETTSVILSSPNGTKFKVTVDDDGILTSTEITE
jgi:hypothetical protein